MCDLAITSGFPCTGARWVCELDRPRRLAHSLIPRWCALATAFTPDRRAGSPHARPEARGAHYSGPGRARSPCDIPEPGGLGSSRHRRYSEDRILDLQKRCAVGELPSLRAGLSTWLAQGSLQDDHAGDLLEPACAWVRPNMVFRLERRI